MSRRGTIGIFEIVYVAAIGGWFAARVEAFDHARDHAAAAGSGKAANEKIVARGRQFDAHLQRAQGAILAEFAFDDGSVFG